MGESRILFVCLGNICRSPLAHGVMLKLIRDRGLTDRISVDSCGTGGWHIGEPAHRGSRAVAIENGVDLGFHKARRFCDADWEQFDWIVAMDRENRKSLEGMRGKRKTKVVLLREFEPEEGTKLDVPDPYYTGGFDEVFMIVQRCCERLLDAVIEQTK